MSPRSSCQITRRFTHLPTLFAALLTSAFSTMHAAELLIDPGVVVKFDQDGGIVTHDRLHVEGAILTSVRDDSLGGQTLIAPSTPAPGDWVGVRVDPGSSAEQTKLSGVRIRYAGQNRGAGLDLQSSFELKVLSISESSIGLRVNRDAKPILRDFSLLQNTVGVLSDSANASIRNSEIVGNVSFGAQNLTPIKALDARSSWWGAASGPFDPLDNPSGAGNRVSPGVDYGQYTTDAPLLDCRVFTPESSIFGGPNVQVSLRCRNALEFRVSESALFAGVAYRAMAAVASLTVSPAAGEKTIYAQFRSANGATRTEKTKISVQYSGIAIEFQSPLEGTVVSDTAPVPIQALTRVISGANVARVEFSLGSSSSPAPISLGFDDTEPYSVEWMASEWPDGVYSLKAAAISTTDVETAARRSITLSRSGAPGDITPPVINAVKFNGVLVDTGSEISAPGLLSAVVSDPGCTRVGGCISGVKLYVNELLVSEAPALNNAYSQSLTFEKTSNGALFLRLVAVDLVGNTRSWERVLTLNLGVPPAPTLSTPLSGSVFTNRVVQITGRAQYGSRVQLYANNVALASTTARLDGVFVGAVNIPGAGGQVQLSADASNLIGTSARSANVPITLSFPAPKIVILGPNPGAIIGADTVISTSVIDFDATANVAFFVDGVPIGVSGAPPFQVPYLIANQIDGPKLVRAVLRHGTTPILEATRAFVLRKSPPAPAPFVPPYVGSGLSATPSLSYGATAVEIRGRMRLAGSTEAAINAPATLVFRRENFDRRVNIVTDNLGEFVYQFMPRSSDEGELQVTAMHPQAKPFDNPTVTGVADFVVSRLSTNPARIAVSAPRNFPQIVPITVRNSLGVEARNVRLVARDADQPGATLPRGITLDGGKALTIPAGGSATFQAQLLNSNGVGPPLTRSGNLIVTVLEESSGNLKRSTARLDYELFDAEPRLIATPISVFTGVRRGQSGTELITLENKGLVPANNLRVTLLTGPGNPLPSWVSLISATNIASFAPGQQAALELRMTPPLSIGDGLYNVKLRVQADNDPGGDIAVSINVNEAGEGSMRFKAVDIYTGTLDANNLPIEGLGAASITLTSEANASLRFQGSTNALGELLLGPMPPGRYRYNAQAASHAPSSGRVLVRPGVTTDERVFLDFNSVSFTWSVTPTTILDHYNINLSATFQTLVPAPVLILDPASINIPELSVGEFVTGELSLTNHGLLRADNVRTELPASNEYYDIQFTGEVPNELAANQRVTLYYRITQLLPLPGDNRAAERASLQQWLSNKAPAPLTQSQQRTGSCNMFRVTLRAFAQFVCTAGDLRPVSTQVAFARAYGTACSSQFPPSIIGGGASSGGGTGGWGGGFATSSTSSGPQCGPDCDQGCACTGGCNPPSPPPDSRCPDCPRPPPPPKECKQ